jgi:hypothetical protein
MWIIIICCETASFHKATQNAPIEEEMTTFLGDNGFKYVTLIENATTPSETKLKMTHTIVKDSTAYVRSLTMNEYQEKYTFRFLDAQVFFMNFEKDNIHIFLQAITRAPVQSSVLCIKSFWTDYEETNFKNILKEFKQDSLFYLSVSSEPDVKWY